MAVALEHRHIVVSAAGLRKVPRLPSEIEDWLRRLVAAVDMKILIEPQAVYCLTPGNEGVTGIACLETSHCSVHVWEGEHAFLRMDLYSCQHFEVEDVLRLVREFEPTEGSWMLIDRNSNSTHLIPEMGSVMRSF